MCLSVLFQVYMAPNGETNFEGVIAHYFCPLIRLLMNLKNMPTSVQYLLPNERDLIVVCGRENLMHSARYHIMRWTEGKEKQMFPMVSVHNNLDASEHERAGQVHLSTPEKRYMSPKNKFRQERNRQKETGAKVCDVVKIA